MNKKGVENYHELIDLDSGQIIEWCIARKKEMGISNARLADITGVPEGTIDRIFTGRNNEYRYSTIQPILRYLIGYNEITPSNESTDYYTNTIEGYKLAVQNKNNSISVLENTCQTLAGQIDLLKKINEEKQHIIDNMINHIKWLEDVVEQNNSSKKIKK